MPFKCPNCDATHEKVPGYVSQEDVQKRINAKNSEIDALKGRVKELEPLASDSDAVRQERDGLKARIAEIEAQVEIDQAFADQKIDSAAREGFKAIHASAMAGKAEEDRIPLHEWIGTDEAREHVLLKAHYGQGDGKPPASVPPANPSGRGVLNTDNGGDPPTNKPQVISPQMLQEYFASEAYTSLPREERRKVASELQGQVKAGKLTALPG